METSCGVVLSNGTHILGCIPYGMPKTKHYLDIPKGRKNSGESPIQTALRELREETGLILSKESLIDLGTFKYRPEKNLHLFFFEKEDISWYIGDYHCTSKFIINGIEVSEMVGYELVSYEEIEKKFFKSLVPILKNVLQY